MSSPSPTAFPDERPLRLVVTSVESDGDAHRLARLLVDERLAACVSILPVEASVYRWEGKICEEAERLLWIKTTPEREAALVERLVELHPYSLPEILRLDAAASRRYRDWVEEETGAGR